MGLIWVLAIGICLVLIQLAWYGFLPLLSATIAAAVFRPLLHSKWHLYWIIPIINASIWEFFIRDEVNAIYFGWIYSAVMGAAGAAVAHALLRQFEYGVQSRALDLVAKVAPFTVLCIGICVAPIRLSIANFDDSATKLSTALTPEDQQRLDNSMKLLFARAKCYRTCTHPNECKTFRLFHNGKTAAQLIKDGDQVAADIRLNYACRVNSLTWELEAVETDNPRYSWNKNEGYPTLQFTLHNKTPQQLRSVYGVVSVSREADQPSTTRLFCCTIPQGLAPRKSTKCVVRLPKTGWQRAGFAERAPETNNILCELVIHSVIAEDGILDFRVVRTEKERCEDIIRRIDQRRFDYGWRHLNVDPDYHSLHGPHVDVSSLREEVRPFFPDEPELTRIQSGEQGQLDTGYSVKGRLPVAPFGNGGVRVSVDTADGVQLVGQRLAENGEFTLFVYPTATDRTPMPSHCSVRIVLDVDNAITDRFAITTD